MAGNLATHHWQLLFLWAVARHDLGYVFFSLKPKILKVKLSFLRTRVQRKEIMMVQVFCWYHCEGKKLLLVLKDEDVPTGMNRGF